MKIERKSSGWKFHIFIHLASFYHFCLLLPLAYTWNRHQHPLCVYDFNLFDLRPVIVRLSFVSLHIDWNGYWNVCHRLFSLLSHQIPINREPSNAYQLTNVWMRLLSYTAINTLRDDVVDGLCAQVLCIEKKKHKHTWRCGANIRPISIWTVSLYGHFNPRR